LQWDAQVSGTTDDLNAIWGSSATDLYAVGNSGTLLHSTGNGIWTAQDSGLGFEDLAGVWGSSATDVYLVGGFGGVVHSTGNGMWTSVANPGNNWLTAIAGNSATDFYVIGWDFTGNTQLYHQTMPMMWSSIDTGTDALFR